MAFPDSLPPPTWVDIGAKPVQGLDLLGLRLPVQVIGYSLLTGVTTITPTVRYLSIHAWIVHSYGQGRHPDRRSDFRAFAARVESAVVLGNLLAAPETVGLIGPDKGRELLQGGDHPLPLVQLAEQLAVTTYAYASVDLGLSFPRKTGIPGLSRERGLALAECVGSQVDACNLGRLISMGKPPESAGIEELAEIGESLVMTRPPSDERAMLVGALLPENPRPQELPRMASYACLLSLAHELGRVPVEGDLFEAARLPQRLVPPEIHGSLDGWLRYSVRDLLAAAGEAAFKQIIATLERLSGDDGNAVPVDAVMTEILSGESDHQEQLRELGLLEPNESPWSLSFPDIHDRITRSLGDQRSEAGGLARWAGATHEWSLMNATLNVSPASLSLLPVAWSLAVLRTEPWDAGARGSFEERFDLGWTRLGLDEVVRPTVLRFYSERTGFRGAAAELGMRIIDQHLRIAWSRLAIDMTRDVSALTTDGSDWRYLGRTVPAARTGSRIAQAIGWLEQLGLIDPSGITEYGSMALQRTLTTLKEAPPESA